MKIVAILQSNYIPWKGYFDMIGRADEFILYDDTQYTRRDWRNRNKIKTPTGAQWLTIPVETKGKYLQKIKETRIEDPEWNLKHWERIRQNYARAEYFREYSALLEKLYLECRETHLSQVNYRFLRAICDVLGIRTKISWSMDYVFRAELDSTERLVDLCKQAGATDYLTGPAAKDYIRPERFEAARIALHYMDYSRYPEYPQLYPPFDHAVSVIDLLLNAGPRAAELLGAGR